MSGFWYLATPYSKHPDGLVEAFLQAVEQAALLIKAGIPVFCPIAHTHPIAVMGDLDPYDHDIWLPADRPFMEAAKGIIVCKLEGWDESFGIKKEIEAFTAAIKPVIYMEPDEVPYVYPSVPLPFENPPQAPADGVP